MARRFIYVPIVTAAAIASFLICTWRQWTPTQFRRLLVSQSGSGELDCESQDLMSLFGGNYEQGFDRWMKNAGLHIPRKATGHRIQDVRDKLLMRILAFCFDVLPTSVQKEYEADFAEIVGIDLGAQRNLTVNEEIIKIRLADEAKSWRSRIFSKNNKPEYFAFLPQFKGRAVPDGTVTTWESPCWHSVSARAVKGDSGWQLEVTVSKAKHLFCVDWYAFATSTGLHVGFFPAPIGGTKSFRFEAKGLTSSQTWDVDTLGIRVFLFKHGLLETVRNIAETAFLAVGMLVKSPPSSSEKRNLEFLERYVGISMKPRSDPGGIILNETEIGSGDFLGIIRLDGLDPMLAWGMGSHTGHTAVAMWEDGNLYVAESTVNSSYWPTNGIQRTPYRKWIEQARAAGYSVVHAPLAPKYRESFNEKMANTFFHLHESLEYGYHALVTGWIDTPAQNYPCLPPYDTPTADNICLQWEFLEVAVPMITKFIPAMEKPFLPAWNLHVTGSATSGLSATELYRAAVAKGMQLASIPAVIEKDGELYPSVYNNGTQAPGIAMVCDVFVCAYWKAAGLFHEIDDEVNCVEQTNIDVYALSILSVPKKRPEACVAADPDNTLCQLTGKFELHLPKLGTRAPYKHMQETCPTEPPNYDRPDDC